MSKKTILVSAAAMWGSIEWILPVCKYMKDNYKDVDIIFFIGRKKKSEVFLENHDLKKLVDQIADGQCYDLFDLLPQWFKWFSKFLLRGEAQKDFSNKFLIGVEEIGYKVLNKLFGNFFMKKWLDAIQPNICLVDAFMPMQLIKLVKKMDVRIGKYPNATSFAFCPKLYCEKLFDLHKEGGFGQMDFLLVDTPWRRDYFQNHLETLDVFMVGPPKYDSFWLNFMNKNNQSGVKKDTKRDQISILVLLKNQSSAVYHHLSFEEDLKNIIDSCRSYTNARILIKPHPRQDLKMLERVMKEHADQRFSVTHASSITLIEEADIVVSMLSGVIINALIQGRPVIEYFDFKKLNQLLRSQFNEIPPNVMGGLGSLDEEGNISSIFRTLQLVESADNKQDLNDLLEQYRDNKLENKQSQVRDVLPDGACKKTAEALFAMM